MQFFKSELQLTASNGNTYVVAWLYSQLVVQDAYQPLINKINFEA